MNKKNIYIDLVVSDVDENDLDLENIQNDLLTYFNDKGMIVGGSINYCEWYILYIVYIFKITHNILCLNLNKTRILSDIKQ